MDRQITQSITDSRLALGVRESAQALGVSTAFLRLEIARKRLQVSRLGRRVVVPAAELQRYLADGMG
jgi:excisionase family DNA binding protein